MVRDRVIRNTAVQFLSRNIGQVSKLAGSIILANIAGAGPLGVFYLFMSLFRIGKRVISLGIGQSVIKRISEQNSYRTSSTDTDILVTALALRLIPVVLISFLAYLFRARLAEYVGLQFSWALLIVVIGLSGTQTALRAVLAGRKRLDLTGYLSIIHDLGTVIAQVALVIVGWRAGGIVLGFVLGTALTTLSALAFVRPSLEFHFSLENVRSLVQFAKFSYLDTLVGGEQRWLDVLILGAFATKAEVGVYGIAYTAAHFGVVFSASLASSIFPEVSSASTADDEGSYRTMVEGALRYTSLFSIPLMFGTVAVGDLVLKVVYGFQTGYLTFSVLTVAFVFFSLTNPIHQSLYGIDSPRFAFYTSLLTTAVNVSLALVLVPQFGILGAASSTAVALGIGFLTSVYLYKREAAQNLSIPVDSWALQFGGAIVMALVVFSMRSLVDSRSELVVAVLIIGGACVYFGVLIAFDDRLRTQLSEFTNMNVKS